MKVEIFHKEENGIDKFHFEFESGKVLDLFCDAQEGGDVDMIYNNDGEIMNGMEFSDFLTYLHDLTVN